MDDAAMTKATGKTLDEWCALLDERGGSSFTHKQIARLLHEDHGVSSWWSQMVTVEYERKIGRRETGQKASGELATTVSKTLAGTMDEVLERWLAGLPEGKAAFDGVPFADEASISRTEKRRYWRVLLEDGAKITVFVSAKSGGDATLLAVETSKLNGRPAIDRWKAFWKAYLARM